MKIKKITFEFYLILGTLFFAFFYFVLRSIFFDNFIWIIVFPLLSISYILLSNNRFTFQNFNTLDTLVYLYLLFGLLITILGLFIGNYKMIVVEVFTHYYLPSIIYFITRKYTSYSISHLYKIINFIWLLAFILIVDIFIEGLFYSYNLSSFIPWAQFEIGNVKKFSIEWYELGFHRVGSIMTSSKASEMVLASLFCFIFPFVNYNKSYKYYSKLGYSKLVNILILLSILICSVGVTKLVNKTSFLSILIFLFIYTLYNLKRLSIRPMFFIFLVSGSILFLFKDYIFLLFVENFINTSYFYDSKSLKGLSVFSYIFDFPRLFENYKNLNFFDSIFGRYIVSGINSVQPFTNTPPSTELRLFTTPIYFGFIWAIISISLIFFIIRICLKLIISWNISRFSYLGFPFLGFYMIYLLDFHYPVFIRHGPIELLFILTGVLSSLYYCYFENRPGFIINKFSNNYE